MTEVWYLISEGYRLVITLPRCVIMMEDTANLSLMDESSLPMKENNLTSHLFIFLR